MYGCRRIAQIIALTSLCVIVLPAQQPTPARLTGTLNVIWGDPDPESGASGETIFWLENLDPAGLPPEFAGRRRIRLQLAAQRNQAIFSFNKTIDVSGRAIQNPVAASRAAEPFVLDVETIEERQTRAITTGAKVSGTKKVIYLLLKYSDDTAVPHPPSFFINLNNPDLPPLGEVFPATLNGFFKKTSYGQFSWVGDVGGIGGVGAPGGWLTLPNPKSFYAPCNFSTSCADLGAIADDGTALGRAQGIDFKLYDNINFVLSNDLDCCAWGGGYYSSVDSKFYGATWEPPWGQETGTYAHEMGHSLGLPHSGWVYYSYDSPWDMMSSRMAAASVICGAYFSLNLNVDRSLTCIEPGDGYIGAHKEYLAWLPAANVTQLTAGATANVSLEALALPLDPAKKKLVKICLNGYACTGSSARYFTVEARVNNQNTGSQFDNGIPGDGIIIHEFIGNRPAIGGSCFFNSQSGWALPIDATPGDYDSSPCGAGGRTYPNYALFNAAWTPGRTYNNYRDGFSVRVISRSGSTFDLGIAPAFPVRRGQTTSD